MKKFWSVLSLAVIAMAIFGSSASATHRSFVVVGNSCAFGNCGSSAFISGGNGFAVGGGVFVPQSSFFFSNGLSSRFASRAFVVPNRGFINVGVGRGVNVNVGRGVRVIQRRGIFGRRRTVIRFR